MNSDPSSGLRPDLLDDFYAECDELLGNLRDLVGRLEAAGSGQPEPATIEGLLRAMHSLKGISAIAGVGASEQLAHGMEDLLRGLFKHASVYRVEVGQVLFDGVQRLEQIVAAHRHLRALPAVDDLLSELKAFSQESGFEEHASPSVTQEGVDPAKQARSRGLRPCLASFSPSAELEQRGVNVNAVRERLKTVGEILAVAPVLGKGTISFQFTVGLNAALEDPERWKRDGIVFTETLEEEADPKDVIGPVPPQEALTLMPSHMLRVDMSRLDELLRITGEMVIQRSRLEECINRENPESLGLKEVNMAFSRSLREMREAISKVRTVPIAETFSRMPFVVRDLSRKSGKKAEVVLEGNQTEIDKYLVERLKEPLLHLVRNSFAHGVETQEERVAANKTPKATIHLRAKTAGDTLVIQVNDDGRGIDADAVKQRALSLGLPVPTKLGSTELLEIICAPGFSTRDEADLAAGRGVGMTVVANAARELGGTLSLETTKGVGTEFTLRLPLTLSIADAVIVVVGGQTYAVPQSAVEEIIQVPVHEVRRIGPTEIVPYRTGLLPFVRLSLMFRTPESASDTLTMLVLAGERGSTGLVVEKVRGQREIVIRSLSDPLLRVPGISGSTELGDGRPILIIDPGAVTRGVVRPSLEGAEQEMAEESAS